MEIFSAKIVPLNVVNGDGIIAILNAIWYHTAW